MKSGISRTVVLLVALYECKALSVALKRIYVQVKGAAEHVWAQKYASGGSYMRSLMICTAHITLLGGGS
jgi:hypothetical protein